MSKYVDFIKTIIEIILVIFVYSSNRNMFLHDFIKIMKYIFILFCILLLLLSIFNIWVFKEEPSVININFVDFVFVGVLAYVLGQYLKRRKHN